SLEIADTQTGEGRVIAHDIGRSLQRVPGGTRFSFLRRDHGFWFLETADPAASDGDIQRVTTMPPGADYVVWVSPTVLLTAAGTEIYRLDRSAGADAKWTPIADFREEGLRNLSRLALSPDGSWLAVVAEPARP
ncbi:MAG: hypothetical protein KGL38_07150, partial [Gemmatimonadota bacterium]|nr:hypothetical protein [Gemmatimonadota bacterium]